MFRGKESSNRIELSRLVQDLLNFSVLGSLQLWGGSGGWGVSGITHTCTSMYTHIYMYRNCKWPPTWRHPCLAFLACLTCMCMRICVCVCTCVCMCACMGHLPHTHTHPHPICQSATPPGDPQNQLKFDNT